LHELNTPKQNINLEKFDGTYKTREKDKIESDIIDKMSAPETEKQNIRGLFAAD